MSKARKLEAVLDSHTPQYVIRLHTWRRRRSLAAGQLGGPNRQLSGYGVIACACAKELELNKTRPAFPVRGTQGGSNLSATFGYMHGCI